MPCYNIIDRRKGIDLAESNNSKDYVFCHNYLFNHEFNFQDFVCNDYHDLTMLSVRISDIATITTKNVDSFMLMLKIVVFFVTLATLKQLIY